jgi:molybdopterin-guanine dinucleotide biosynthesis protein A
VTYLKPIFSAIMTNAVTALVLVGGQSSRMGSDKALLRLPDGESLLEHALAMAATVASEVKLVGPRQKYVEIRWAGEVVEDTFPGTGPLGGIHAGLTASSTDLNLVLAVDMPAVTSELLRFLVQTAQTHERLVTAFGAEGRWQPLCAVYRKGFARVAEDAITAGRCKVDASFTEQIAHQVSEDDLRLNGFSAELFTNCNTAEEWQRFAAHSRQR